MENETLRNTSKDIDVHVSVVIPFYNAQAYIADCCNALFMQSLKNIEYIFVDDGSTDSSRRVINEILERYPHRIHRAKFVVHPENRGVVVARRSGVMAATGEYIIHCDADDRPEHQMYERLWKKAKEQDADIVSCDIVEHCGHIEKPAGEIPTCDSPQIYLQSLLHARKPKIRCWLWNKLIRGSLYRDVTWPDGVEMAEDMIILSQIVPRAGRIAHVNSLLYHYNIREGSLSRQEITREYIEKHLRTVHALREALCRDADDAKRKLFTTVAPFFLQPLLEIRQRYCGNSEFRRRFSEFRRGIWRSTTLSPKNKLLLWLATYNYTFAHHLKHLF